MTARPQFKRRVEDCNQRVVKLARAGLLALLAVLVLVGLIATGIASEAAPAHADNLSATATPGKVEVPAGGQGSETPGDPTSTLPPGWGGWEVRALSDLAQVLSWPQVVKSDTNGRLSVQRTDSLDAWSVAFIKPFEYEAGAQSAFDGEQQDALLSGYGLTSSTFYSFPAYSAVLYDTGGNVSEVRFHWLADSWILGVELHGSFDQAPDTSLIAEQLLAAAVNDGLAAPDGVALPTAIPTAGNPSPVASQTPCGTAFSDVPPDFWAYDYVSELSCVGVISGYGDGTFRPQNAATRAQFVKMVVRSEGWDLLEPPTPTFSDVDSSHVFFPYVETAYAHSLISGYGDGQFRPDAYVTRAQVAKMVVRARGWAVDVQAPVRLCDVDLAHWAWPYVQVAISHGLFTGYGDGCFRPDALATRAQLAKVLVVAHQP